MGRIVIRTRGAYSSCTSDTAALLADAGLCEFFRGKSASQSGELPEV